MLLTLSAGPWWNAISRNGDRGQPLLELPQFAIRRLELRGLNLPASMLSGWTLEQLDRLRDRADKAGCPCLVLFEDQPLRLSDKAASARAAARDRIGRLAVAANRLGCNSLALRVDGRDTDEELELIATEVRTVMPGVERLELNVLVMPGRGVTALPERLTELIKQIGGFRIGSLPTFAHAASCESGVEALRKLAPYAGAVHATIAGFNKGGEHRGYDLAEYVQAIRSVGFVNTLAIDYVGNEDAVEAIDRARRLLQEAIDAEASPAGQSS